MSEALANVSCVAVNGRAVLISGAPGSGKSSLVLALIDRGGMLVGDDGVRLEARDGRAWACPPPNIAGKLEIRNVGLADLPTVEAPLALAICLDPAAPRHVDMACVAQYGEWEVPQIALYPNTPALAMRVEWALRLHGLP